MVRCLRYLVSFMITFLVKTKRYECDDFRFYIPIRIESEMKLYKTLVEFKLKTYRKFFLIIVCRGNWGSCKHCIFFKSFNNIFDFSVRNLCEFIDTTGMFENTYLLFLFPSKLLGNLKVPI